MERRDLDDRYYVGSLLGQGGLAKVYRYDPWDVGKDLPLAVKVMRGESYCGPLAKDNLGRFEFEAAASIDAAALRPDLFPQIVEVRRLATGQVRSIVMELMQGENLREYLLSRQLHYKEAVSISLAVLQALQSLHSVGILHRDVKLENVFICKDGRIKLIDFGYAGSTSRPMNSSLGGVFGSLSSLAPEVFDGETMDFRSDIYSAGVLLYESLARKKMHLLRTYAEACEFHSSDRRPGPLPYGVPDELKAIVMKMVEKNPDERYQNAKQASIALAEFAVKCDPSLRTVEPYYSALGRATDQYQWL